MSHDKSVCSKQAGAVVPRIDRNRCEAKGDCVRVCPFSVFEIQVLQESDRVGLSWRGKLKAWAHGIKGGIKRGIKGGLKGEAKQAYVVAPEACHACGLCVKACPEKAITLLKIGPGSP